MRRFIALILLIFSTATSLEAVVGQVRDGEVHHETAARATQHAARTTGEHGHEHGMSAQSQDRDASGEEHGPKHQHGTGADHCTHAHGPALSADGSHLTAASVRARMPRLDVPVPSEITVPPLYHPPRI
jgi:ABC-type nickel/cobalt efflux system permease component RcnA